ncbi:MAG: hypothetical protein INR73_19425 [Williamsia sp.]|nr:hypothetical protein [Williamsia sp.]
MKIAGFIGLYTLLSRGYLAFKSMLKVPVPYVPLIINAGVVSMVANDDPTLNFTIGTEADS